MSIEKEFVEGLLKCCQNYLKQKPEEKPKPTPLTEEEEVAIELAKMDEI